MIPESERCRSCGAPVIWRKHVRTGRPMPIDWEPSPKGNLVLLGADSYGLVASGLEGSPGCHLSHFATCPKADDWRRKRPSGGLTTPAGGELSSGVSPASKAR